MFEVTFLGTAASTPSAERGLPALLVGAGGRRFLVDCGEGTQRQILRAGAGFRRLDHVLLTHAHLDHVLGLAGLIATLGLLDMHSELAICGSGETVEFAERYLLSLWPHRQSPVPLRFAALEPGPVLTDRAFSLRCFDVWHRGTQSLGFRFDEAPRRHLRPERLQALGVPGGPLRGQLAAGKLATLPDGRRIDPEEVLGPVLPGASLAVIGDTEEVDTLIEPAREADALVVEATFLEADFELAKQRGHLTAAQAGRLAAEAGVGALYLTHISGRYDPAEIAAEAGALFPNVKVAADFDRIEVLADRHPSSEKWPRRPRHGPVR
jgi:ribonuclease Z